jgi:hypothetical protein
MEAWFEVLPLTALQDRVIFDETNDKFAKCLSKNSLFNTVYFNFSISPDEIYFLSDF